MDWKTTTAIIGGSALIITTMGYIIKIQHDTVERLKFIETSVVESKDIGKGIIREQSSYVTKTDLERIIKEQGLDISSIKSDLNKLDAHINGISSVKVVTQGYSADHLSSSSSTPRSDPPANTDTKSDPYNYQKSTQWFNVVEPIGKENVPVGSVGFSAWEAKPWRVTISPRIYSSTTVLGINEDGRTYAYSRFQIEVNGNKYIIPITEAKIAEEVPTPSFRFSPRLYFGTDFGLITNPPMKFELVPNLTLSLFSYGETKSNPDWTFLNLGIGYETQKNGLAFILSPVNYNIAKHLPFVDNLFLGPGFSLDPHGNFGTYIGIRVGL